MLPRKLYECVHIITLHWDQFEEDLPSLLVGKEDLEKVISFLKIVLWENRKYTFKAYFYKKPICYNWISIFLSFTPPFQDDLMCTVTIHISTVWPSLGKIELKNWQLEFSQLKYVGKHPLDNCLQEKKNQFG